MHIAFWTMTPKVTGVTSNIVAIATYASLNYNLKTLLVGNQYSTIKIDEYFLETDDLSETMTYEFDTGIDALIRYSKYNKLSEEVFKNYTTILLKNRLDLLESSHNLDGAEFLKDINYVYNNIFSNGKKIYDLIITDASVDNTFSEKQLEDADIIVVNLSQNIRYIELFFESSFYRKYKGKLFYLLGKYDDASKYNYKNLSRKYKFGEKSSIVTIFTKEKNIGVIPYNTDYFDALLSKKPIEFFLKSDCNYFIKGVDQVINLLFKKLNIEVESNWAG